jgi:hypothetical protein
MSKNTSSLFEHGRRFTCLAVLCLLVFSGGCCPYTQGLIADVNTRTTLSKAEAFRYLHEWFDRSGYRIWKSDETSGFIRASLAHASDFHGFEVEDVLAATISETGGNVKLDAQAETYRISGRRQKVKVSKEAKEALSSIKDGLARGGVIDSSSP